MRRALLIPVIAVAALTGCTQMSDKDRAMLQQTHDLALQAKNEADAASAKADQAEERCDRIFRQSQNK